MSTIYFGEGPKAPKASTSGKKAAPAPASPSPAKEKAGKAAAPAPAGASSIPKTATLEQVEAALQASEKQIDAGLEKLAEAATHKHTKEKLPEDAKKTEEVLKEEIKLLKSKRELLKSAMERTSALLTTATKNGTPTDEPEKVKAAEEDDMRTMNEEIKKLEDDLAKLQSLEKGLTAKSDATKVKAVEAELAKIAEDAKEAEERINVAIEPAVGEASTEEPKAKTVPASPASTKPKLQRSATSPARSADPSTKPTKTAKGRAEEPAVKSPNAPSPKGSLVDLLQAGAAKKGQADEAEMLQSQQEAVRKANAEFIKDEMKRTGEHVSETYASVAKLMVRARSQKDEQGNKSAASQEEVRVLVEALETYLDVALQLARELQSVETTEREMTEDISALTQRVDAENAESIVKLTTADAVDAVAFQAKYKELYPQDDFEYTFPLSINEDDDKKPIVVDAQSTPVADKHFIRAVRVVREL